MSRNLVNIRIQRRWLRAIVVTAVLAAATTSTVALASHRFDDVSSGNVFHEDITWLKESGVTVGCNPPANTEYCPEESVTREQMAAFMRRLAENQVVDAARLEGSPPDDFAQDLMWVESAGTSRIGPQEETDFSVTCPEGTLVVSGGSREEGDDYVLTDSYPAADRSGWVATYQNQTTSEAFSTVVVHALCAAYDDKSPTELQPAGEDPNQR